MTTDLVYLFVSSGKSQLSVIEVDRCDIVKYEVCVSNILGAGIAGLVEEPFAN